MAIYPSSEFDRVVGDKAYVQRMAGKSPQQVQDAAAEDEAFERVAAQQSKKFEAPVLAAA